MLPLIIRVVEPTESRMPGLLPKKFALEVEQ